VGGNFQEIRENHLFHWFVWKSARELSLNNCNRPRWTREIPENHALRSNFRVPILCHPYSRSQRWPHWDV